eukprot:TRINITY_DN5872_c0_g3_i1.p1 TRINITY_DN5872_c0_g3~~TRINITY_DN5872_c0_g3_i1.p1  ORF type:complete len:415 (-),score=160.33 TRINITY_DN5872_c0_g3_i1:376-1620(-)
MFSRVASKTASVASTTTNQIAVRSLSNESFIIDCVRSPIGRGREDGMLHGTEPGDLLANTLSGLMDRNPDIPMEKVDDVITGIVTQTGKQGANLSRLATLKAGFPVTTAATTINRMCGSSQQAINFASAVCAVNDAELNIAAGVEMMSKVQMFSDCMDLVFPKDGKVDPFIANFPYPLIHQGISAEQVAEKYGVSREECDLYAKRSHELAAEAFERGFYNDQILKMTVDGKACDRDEGVRVPVDWEKLTSLKPVFKEGGAVTAGNASQISDGASAVLIGSESFLKSNPNVKPKARIVARAVVGSEPEIMLDGVIPATEKVLAKAGLTIDDIDLFEINEAFASVVLGWSKTVGADLDRVNVNGGGIAHGHPLGATGGVLMAKLVNGLKESGKKYGLQSMCIGHGMATATIIENLE